MSFKQHAFVWVSIILCLLKPSPIANKINIRLRKIWCFMWITVRLQYWVSPSFEDCWPTKHNPGEKSAKHACGLWHRCLNKSCSGPCPAPALLQTSLCSPKQSWFSTYISAAPPLCPSLSWLGQIFSAADTIRAALTSGRQVGDSSIFTCRRCLLHCPWAKALRSWSSICSQSKLWKVSNSPLSYSLGIKQQKQQKI